MSNRRSLRVAFFTTDNPLGHSGIDRYTSDLLRELVKRSDLQVVPVASSQGAAMLRECVPDVQDLIVTKAAEGPLRSVEERYGLGRQLASAQLDVVHGTKHILPRVVPCPTVLTVYDLFAFTRRRDYRWSKRLLLPMVYRRSMTQADRIIALSHSIRQQVVARGLVAETKIDVVPAAVSSVLATVAPEAISALTDVPFALCVGDLSPRKNVELLLRILPAVHRQTGLMLALVGPDRSRSESMRAGLAALERAGVVVRAGGVSDGALRWCYEHAEVVLIPSLEEGYGLPAIEARHFGAALVTSRDPALVEVSGDAALHLDGTDAGAWERAIVASIGSRGEHASAATLATWTEIAEQTADVYHRAASAVR
jgi:glycosyltransferase involved in cell wall biosynthesis